MRKILFFILLLMASHTFADTIVKDSTVYLTKIDTVLDTLTVKDTFYTYDTTVGVAKQVADLKGEFYDQAIKSIDSKQNTFMTTISVIVGVLAIFISVMLFILEGVRKTTIAEGEKAKKASEEVYQRIQQKEKQLSVDIATKISDLNTLSQKSLKAADNEASKKGITDFEEKIKLINESDAKVAVDSYENLLFELELQNIPNTRIPLILRKKVGLNYLKLKNLNSALVELENYYKHYSNDEETLFSLGFIYGELFDSTKDFTYLESAIDKYKELIKIDARGYAIFYNWGIDLGNLFEKEKNFRLLEEAIEKFKLAEKLNPSSDSVYYNWGITIAKLFKEKNDYSLLEIAIEKFRKSLELNNKKDNAYNNWGVSLLTLFKKDNDYTKLTEAIDKFKLSVELNNENHNSLYSWGIALNTLFEKDNNIDLLTQAIDKFEKAQVLRTDDIASMINCGVSYGLMYDLYGETSKLYSAINLFKKAVKVNPNSVPALLNLGLALTKNYKSEGDEKLINQAVILYEDVLNINSMNDIALYNKACAYALLENKILMLENLEKAIELDYSNKQKANEDEDFEKYWDDPEFIELTKDDDDDKADEKPTEES